MDIEYAARLAECYKRLHMVIRDTDDNTSWPVCSDPAKRHEEFLDFLEAHKNEEWAKYYRELAVHLEPLIWLKLPKGKPKDNSL